MEAERRLFSPNLLQIDYGSSLVHKTQKRSGAECNDHEEQHWGQHVRSYVTSPLAKLYPRRKETSNDLRTGFQTFGLVQNIWYSKTHIGDCN
jgi:hypothetical protein